MTGAVQLVLDGTTCAVEPGTSYLDAFAGQGVSLPTLCHHPRLTPVGSCGVCAIEVRAPGRSEWRLVSACATRVEAGTEARSSSDALTAARQLTLQLLLDRHDPALRHLPERAKAGRFPIVCACRGHARCELRSMCRDLGAVPGETERPVAKPAVALRPRLELEPSKCVLCERCVRACQELAEVGALGLVGRGRELRVAHALAPDSSALATCDTCAEGSPPCVEVCPTDALHAPHPKKGGRK